jgi:sugar O-acyltransferase (sialic acid O-acetyltransferase NeuD family)
MSQLVIIGSGGHAGVVIDAINYWNYWKDGRYTPRLVIVDDTLEPGQMRHGRIVSRTGNITYPDLCEVFIAIGDNAVRERISAEWSFVYTNVIHPKSDVRTPILTRGNYIGANAVINPGCRVGNFCIINTGAILEHDSSIGDFSSLAPGVVTGGRVKIGDRTAIGLGAMIRDGVTIGNNCSIGMGAVVLDDIPDNSTAWGNPARIQK